MNRFLEVQSQQLRRQVDDISMCSAGEAVKVVIVEFHAGMGVVVERAERHSISLYGHPVLPCGIGRCNGCLDGFNT